MDRPALDKLIVDNYEWLRAYGHRLGRSPALGQDLAHETVERMIVHADQFDGANFRAWASTIMFHCYMNSKRRGAREPLLEVLPVQVIDGKDAEYRVEFREVCEYLDMCQPDHRDAIAAYVAGVEYEELAQALNIPKGTIKSRISRGRAELLKHIGEENRYTDAALRKWRYKRYPPSIRKRLETMTSERRSV